MEKTIQVKIQNCGKAVGTIGWWSNLIQTSNVIIKPDKLGRLSAFLEYEGESCDGIKNGRRQKKIAFVATESDFNCDGYAWNFKGKVAYVSVSDCCYTNNLFDVAWTPKAKDAATKFVDEVVEQLIKTFEKN